MGGNHVNWRHLAHLYLSWSWGRKHRLRLGNWWWQGCHLSVCSKPHGITLPSSPGLKVALETLSPHFVWPSGQFQVKAGTQKLVYKLCARYKFCCAMFLFLETK